VCGAVRYYEHWVNGAELRVAQLAAGAYPRSAPQPHPQTAPKGVNVALELAAHDSKHLALPALDTQALAPIKHVLLHGSMATGDACDFSDVDIAVFVDDMNAYAAEQHHAAVIELRRLLHGALAFDSLMHHGLMFSPAHSLQAYDQRFLPVDTLARARVLHGAQTLQVCVSPPDLQRFSQALRSCCASLRLHVESGDFLQDDYRLKNFLSGVLLMPARILAARGTYVYKRESFELARSLFSNTQWEFVARCEALRALWQRPPAPLTYRTVPETSHPRLLQIIGRWFAPRLNTRRLSSTMVDGLTRSAHRFLARVEEVA
jgi:predicted nucleotidyltransferase